MKPNYKNWVPKGMIFWLCVGTIVVGIVAAEFGVLAFSHGALWTKIAFALFVLLFIGLFLYSGFMFILHNTFSYEGKKKLSKTIVEGTAEAVHLADGETCLDVGCGSGALTIAVAKRFPKAKVVGVDRWGKEYASFSKVLCESNAKAEGVNNVTFQKGDALSLPFPDNTFDAVTSNYVYHNIPSNNRQAILLETLRVLKKGGTFAIHDIFSKQKYGDMLAFLKKLQSMGYEKVELLDTTKGKFMSEKEAKYLMLSSSALLVGKK